MEDRSGGGCWDGGLLEISTDGGNNFDQVPNSAMFSDPMMENWAEDHYQVQMLGVVIHRII